MKRVLIVDDDASFREVVKFNLEEEGFSVIAAATAAEALTLFQTEPTPVVVTDLKMPGMDGMALLGELKRASPDTCVIVITAFGDIETAVRAMKAGAFDFLPKPCDRNHFRLMIRRAWEHAALKTQVLELQLQLKGQDKEMVFQSMAMERIVSQVDRIAEADVTVLITGESGSGKELIAARIHRTSSRRNQPFVTVNCAAIPRDLLESELFGHVRGAFTGAIKDRKGKFVQALGGTVFLDEIGDLPQDMQTRLLRVIQERTIDVIGRDEPQEVNVRIIAATNRDLTKAIQEGSFREDLFYRLNVFPIHLPPLRERVEDILPLINHFLKKYNQGHSFPLPPPVIKRMEQYQWPGNVRELENICQRIVLLGEHAIDESMLPLSPKTENIPLVISPSRIELPAAGVSLTELERDIIIKALEINKYNQSATAQFLQIPRHILLYRIEKYRIPLNRD